MPPDGTRLRVGCFEFFSAFLSAEIVRLSVKYPCHSHLWVNVHPADWVSGLSSLPLNQRYASKLQGTKCFFTLLIDD